jgi:hypothetical protein
VLAIVRLPEPSSLSSRGGKEKGSPRSELLTSTLTRRASASASEPRIPISLATGVTLPRSFTSAAAAVVAVANGRVTRKIIIRRCSWHYCGMPKFSLSGPRHVISFVLYVISLEA